MIRRPLTPSLAATLFLASALSARAADDFASELDALVAAFPGAVESEAELEALKERAGALDDRLRDHRRAHRRDMSDAEKQRIEELDDDVDAFEEAVRVVGQLGNTADMSLDDFERAARRLGLEATVVRAEQPELGVVRVDVGTYRSFLIRNGTSKSYTIGYAWRTPSMERPQGGVGSSLCKTLTVLASRVNSRDHDVDGIEFTELRFTPMPGAAARLGKCD